MMDGPGCSARPQPRSQAQRIGHSLRWLHHEASLNPDDEKFRGSLTGFGRLEALTQVMTGSIDSVLVEADAADSYSLFVRDHGPLLRRALVARFGVDVGRDAADEALLRGWRDWPRVAAMDNPVGYLFRVGQTAARPQVRWQRRTTRLDFPREGLREASHDNVDLLDALRHLKRPQRLAVILIKAHGHTYAETAAALSISEAAVGNHLRRGLEKLRRLLGDEQ